LFLFESIMVRILKAIAFAAIAISFVDGKDKKFSSGKIEVKISGKSGKFKIYRKDAGENETNKVEVEMDALTEVDINGTEVGKKNKVKHTIKSFAKQDFVFTEPKLVNLGYKCYIPYTVKKTVSVTALVKVTEPVKTGNVTQNVSKMVNKTSQREITLVEEKEEVCKGANASILTFNSDVSGIGKIKVDTYIVDTYGFAGPDEDSLWTVAPGDMKFNIELSDWKYCGSTDKDGKKTECLDGKDKKSEIGEFIDIDIKIKGKKPKAEKKPKGEDKGRKGKGKKDDYDLGGAVNLRLTNLITVDGKVVEMPAGYPMVKTKGSSQIFTFRFPKFATRGVYDPIATTGTKVAAPTPASVEKISEAGKVAVKIIGKSGKFTVYNKAKGLGDANKVTVEMDALREIDASGNEVGKSGSIKHSINTFAAQDFQISAPESVKMGVNNSVSATKVNFISSVSGIGTIYVDTFVMNSAGSVGPDGEPWPVVAGDMKFNVALSGWSFCDAASCKDGIGDSVELDIKMKGKNPMALKTPGSSKNKFDLGGGVKLQLTNKILVDGKQMTMQEGYPKYDAQKQVFTFRFPKFAYTALYDPLLSYGTTDGMVTSQAAGRGSCLFFSLMFAALISKLLL